MTDKPHDPDAVPAAAALDLTQTGEEVAGRDGGPVDEEDMAAADELSADPEVAENYEEMIEKGAATRGEGRLP